MRKEFYIGQPLIVKGTGEKATFFDYDDRDEELPCNVLKYDGYLYHSYYDYEELEPSTEVKFSEIITGLEQGYFEVGTEFRIQKTGTTVKVQQGNYGLYLERSREPLFLTSIDIDSTWTLVEPYKEMTLEEIEAELGYKIKLKDNGGN